MIIVMQRVTLVGMAYPVTALLVDRVMSHLVGITYPVTSMRALMMIVI